MKVSDLAYHLPDELIAQQPLAERSASRMLVVDRTAGTLRDQHFRDLPEYLTAGDCLVLNDSKVIRSRLFGRRKTGGAVEVFLLKKAAESTWQALVRPAKRVKVGELLEFPGGVTGEILSQGHGGGERTVQFHCALRPAEEVLEEIGHIPLPPYIKRPDEASDNERYQTIYARERGSVAAPTAGLHFTEGVMQRCRQAGAGFAQVTLHVGLGTFQPLSADEVSEVKLHSESYSIDLENATKMRSAKRLVCVGTTSLRTIESAGLRPGSGETGLLISPGYRFLHAGALLTNFHLPGTSLLLLVAAFAGVDLTKLSYAHAVREQYRFYSYGDCMLIL
jgi:S-adenosylmethionine:tRNA ribosyltransferase-isomerase